MKPAAMKDGKLYSQQPHSGAGDFNFSRADGVQTRINKHGLIETVANNEPRLSYSIVDGKVSDCPHLLLEPSRTNIVPYSNDFNQHSITGGSITSDDIVSPDGSINADTFVEDTNSSYHFIREDISVSSGTYTLSVFVKGTSRFFSLYPQSAGVAYALFDIASETITKTGGANYVNSDIQNYGNGWYRCILTYTVSTGISFLHIYLSNSSTSEVPVYTGNGSEMSFYGLQLEAGGYATSYIPTSGSTVTRSADECTDSGTSAEFNDSEGVLFAETAALADDLTNRRLSLSDGTDFNRMALTYNTSSNTLFCFVVSNNTTVATLSYAVSDIKQFHKVGLKYKQNDFALWVDGFEVVTDSGGNTPTGLDELKFEQAAGGNGLYGKTKQLSTFKTALTDSELEKITSWESFFDMAKGQEYNVKL